MRETFDGGWLLPLSRPLSASSHVPAKSQPDMPCHLSNDHIPSQVTISLFRGPWIGRSSVPGKGPAVALNGGGSTREPCPGGGIGGPGGGGAPGAGAGANTEDPRIGGTPLGTPRALCEARGGPGGARPACEARGGGARLLGRDMVEVVFGDSNIFAYAQNSHQGVRTCYA